MKKILIFAFLLLGIVAWATLPAKTKIQSYYSGDAVNYNGNLVVASTNSESLEVFVLERDGLKRKIILRPFNSRFDKDDSFYSVKLNIENGSLYAYTISGFTIYKYNISNLNDAILVKESTNTYWEWYGRVDKIGNNIVTISAKGISVFNTDLEAIDRHEITHNNPYNISSAGHSDLVFVLEHENNGIRVYDKNSRRVVSDLQINFFGKENNRASYFDYYDNSLYFADDRSVKKVGLDGSLRGTFEHIGYPGYDVASSNNEFLYFANGLGIVKLRKSDMSVINSRRTGKITVSEGWAMGLKVVALGNKENIVLFNNSSIVVLNDNLETLGYFAAGKSDKVYAQENLFLNLSSGSVDSGMEFQVSGGGFLPNEKLTINFSNAKYETQADKYGRFSKSFNAPGLENSRSSDRVVIQSQRDDGLNLTSITEKTDVKVDGQDSGYTYSIGLEINETIINN